MSKELCDVRICWDMSKVDMEKLFEIERLMREMGVSFDTGAGCGCREWEWDWSLEGPVKVEFCCLTKDRNRKKTFSELYYRKVAEKYWMNDRDNNLHEIKLYQIVSKEDGSCNAWRFEEWENDELKEMVNFPNNKDGAYNHFFARRNELDSSLNVKTRKRGANDEPTKQN